jgi:hypothetical protein
MPVQPMPDMTNMMLNSIIDLENELKLLKKKVKSKEADAKIDEDDVDQLKYVQKEIQQILSSL